jgi:formimidoylglutamate deiminase
MLRAAKNAGIRMVLLNCYYRTGGVDQPLAGGQFRFRTRSPAEYWEQFDRLAASIDAPMQSLGVAPHSIRAASIEEIAQLHDEACRRRLVIHMHVEEQPKEIEECIAHYGKTPMALINQHLPVNPMMTAIHCTHTAAADMEEFLSKGGNVCVNPLTEGNLGDGIPAAGRILRKGGHICLGSDSNTRLCWTEEMRWLEYGQRLTTLQRGICADDEGRVAPKLFEMATANGARALGVKAGRIHPGLAADFFTLDLNVPSLAGWSQDTLLDAFIFGTGNEAIADVCVGGTWRIANEIGTR